MLPKKHRLNRSEISQIKKNVSPLYTPLGIFYVTVGLGKAAVIVTKKIHKHAVVRNQIRRRLYKVVESTGFSNRDFIFYPNHTIIATPPEKIAQKISSIIET